MKTQFSKIINKGKVFFYTNIAHWNTPAKGNYVSNKEILNFSLCGMGRDMLLRLVSYLGLGIGNTLYGSALGIRPTHIQAMNIIVMLIDIIFIGIRAYIVDNTNTKWGRFRPFVFITAIPLFVIATVFMYLPFELMTYSYKIGLVFCFSLAIVIVRPYFDGAVSNIGSVITPNTKERTKVLTVFSILYSTAPTIYGFIIPILSDFTGGYTDVRTYRYILVPIAAIGVILSMATVFKCKERFIVPKGYKEKSNLFKSSLEVFKNKYWWIRTLSTWLAFMEWAVGNMFLWSFVYGSQDMTSYAFFNFFIGESALIAMLLTPMMLNKLGNRKLIVIQNALNVVFLGIVLVTFKQPFLFFVVWFLNSLINYFSVVYSPVFTAEINDYQHYVSGKRLDGVMSFANMIGLPITMATGLFVPALMESLGITTNYDILYEPMVRNNVFTVLCVCSIIGAVMNLVPQFFYNYSRAKHKNIVKVLRYRAMLADYTSGDLSSTTLKDGLDGYYSYLEIINADTPNIKQSKENLKNAKLMPKVTVEEKALRKSEIKRYKKKLKEDKELITEKKEAKLFTKELEKYNDNKLQFEISLARKVIALDVHELATKLSNEIFNIEFNSLSDNYKENNKLLKKYIRRYFKMVNLIKKNYPDGIKEIDKSKYKTASNMSTTTKAEIKLRYKAMKVASIEQKVYNNTLDFYLRCKRLVVECDSRNFLEDIEAKYEEACFEVENNYKREKEKDELEKMAKKEDIERLRKLKFDKLPPKKQAKIVLKIEKQKEKNKQKEKTELNDKGDENE